MSANYLTHKIYHIISKTDWDSAQVEGAYHPASLETEGFIHCSFNQQVKRTAILYYSGREDLLLLCIETAGVHAEIRFEDTVEAGMDFPHVYGPLNLDAVEKIFPLEIDPSGNFILPPSIDD